MSTRGALGSPSTRQIITWQLWLCGVSGDRELGKSLSSPCTGGWWGVSPSRIYRCEGSTCLEEGEECEYQCQPSTITSPSTTSPLINKWDSRSGWNSVYCKWGLRKTIQQGFLVFKLRVERISAASSHQHCTFCGILWVYLWFQFKPIIDRKGLFKEILCYTLTTASSTNLCVWSGNNDDLDLSCKTLT